MRIQDHSSGEHNIGHYKKLIDRYKTAKEENEKRKDHSDIFRIGKIINPVSELLTQALMGPVIASYNSLGGLTVRITGCYSEEKAEALLKSWDDPVSTETIIKVSTWIRDKSRPIAASKPTTLPKLSYFHRAWIGLFQNIHIISKDAVDLLLIPQKLRETLSPKAKKKLEKAQPPVLVELEETGQTVSKEKIEKQELSTFSEIAVYGVKKSISFLQECVQYLIEFVVRVVKRIFIGTAEETPLNDPEKPAKSGQVEAPKKKWTQWLSFNVVNALREKAIKILDNSELSIRKKGVYALGRKMTHQTIKFTISTSLRGAIGAGGYLLARRAFTYWTGHHDIPPEVIKVTTVGVNLLGAYFWVRCLTPALDTLYDDYKENYNPDAATVVELKKILSAGSIGSMFTFLKNRLLHPTRSN